jgi:putative tryptophan/tyrosine transport system substrate-binding protein
MRRREFVTLLGSAAAAWPLAARAQQPAIPVVGFLHSQTPDTYADSLAGFRKGLKEGGYVEGQNVAVEYRWGNNQDDQLPALAADLVRHQVAAILTAGGAYTALAAKAATSTIPIVFTMGGDPVKFGLVTSLNRPGGNVTGVSRITYELGAKRLEILRAMVPQATTVGFLVDPRSVQVDGRLDDLPAAARTLGWEVIVLEARSEGDIDSVFASLIQRGGGALVVGFGPLFNRSRDKLVALAARYKIPTISQYREITAAGGLMSYGAGIEDSWRLGGVYIAQILKGAKPADLPVQQSTKFDLVINLKTAKALGLDIPPSLLAIADEVIE